MISFPISRLSIPNYSMSILDIGEYIDWGWINNLWWTHINYIRDKRTIHVLITYFIVIASLSHSRLFRWRNHIYCEIITCIVRRLTMNYGFVEALTRRRWFNKCKSSCLIEWWVGFTDGLHIKWFFYWWIISIFKNRMNIIRLWMSNMILDIILCIFSMMNRFCLRFVLIWKTRRRFNSCSWRDLRLFLYESLRNRLGTFKVVMCLCWILPSKISSTSIINSLWLSY